MAETSNDIKYIPVKEFRELGYLQELNRRFLHPLGLALSVKLNDDGTESLGDIWDYRDDPEGIRYHESVINNQEAKLKIDYIRSEMAGRMQDREKTLGYWIQPAPE